MRLTPSRRTGCRSRLAPCSSQCSAGFEEAWTVAEEVRTRRREVSGHSEGEYALASLATLAGDHEAAARYLRTYCDRLEQRGQLVFLSTFAPLLGRSLCALGRHAEAEPWAQLGRELGDDQDVMTQMLWRQVQALVHAHRGEHAQAEPLAREAVAIGEQTDGLNWQGDALNDLAEVLHAAGREDEARATREQALDRYERKRNLAMAAQVRERLAAIAGASTGAQLS